MDPPRPKATQTNFAYPNYRQPQPIPEYAQPSQYQQYQQYEQYQDYPPHPSVRVPPNVKLNARQVPAGVGVAPPPVRYDGQQRQPQRPAGSGMLIQDFRFPVAPPIPASRSGRARQDPSQSPGRKYNMHESYMSSVVGDSTSAGTTPASRSRGFPTPRAYSGSIYAESEVLGHEERFEHSPQTSPPSSPEQSPQIVRQASLGKRAKPAMTTIKNRTSQLEREIPEQPPTPVQTSRTATMNALSAAVAAGINVRSLEDRSGTPGSRSYTPVRMPFDSSPPASPSVDREFLQTPKSPQTIASTNMLEQLPGSGHSHKSTKSLLGLGIEQSSMSNRIPASRRPPKLDMDAVREAENRGSTTSLADLIKRATRLAANLDRGKTASRLGMLDMFGSSDRLDGANRHSTMSDMISAFPAPAVGGTPTTRRDTQWPLGEKGDAYASTTDLSKSQQPRKQRRRCCGLSLPVLFALIVVIIILIAAAVLIPIFLVLVPKQHHSSTGVGACATSHPCRNGGSTLLNGDTCACVCSNGFTGSQCETSGNTEDCVTKTLKDGSTEYHNATLGRSILTPLSDGETQFDIPLNISTVLSVFSTNNLSCTGENSLVDFNSSGVSQGTERRMKRFIILPGLEPTLNDRLPVIHRKPDLSEVTRRASPDRDVPLRRRQDAATVGTSNGIVFQATSATVGPVSSPSASIGTSIATVTSVSGIAGSDASATGSSAASASTSPAGSGSDSNAKASATVTDEELEFARVVVLYVLQESRTISVAIHAQQQMEGFFASQAKGSSNSTVDVGSGNLHLTANFDAFSITKGDGEVVGSKQS
ncbi:hypothetical protein A1O3_09703 [Capronia epimyces CBS 606.96]|uniref:EGF-like domain-containing protein n=1 Tax=Capronia epimyces CBS 606.96 TaxID=1182542 RepID=W9XAH1_9EURO|nr:uncharacterized protein A1O3_09703 [Capronia epimyces CBS 606.96]EXJ77477.1 hypothetical protein A1O3_09703 [Capronia epimyces CBS 606.96]